MSASVYDLSADLSYEKALAVLSEDLSFCEKLAIAEVAELENDFDHEVFFKEARYARFDLVEQVKRLHKVLPDGFINWCIRKKLNLKDFRAFVHDFSPQNDSTFFDRLAHLDPTKHTGLQIIEFYFDLIAQTKISTNDIINFKKADTLLAYLQKKRFSAALTKDKKIEDEISKIKIASGIRASFRRTGDKRQIKIELEADSPEQLKNKLEKTLEKTESFKKAWSLEA